MTSFRSKEKGSEVNGKNLRPAAKHGGGTIMLRGCVAGSGTGNISRVEGKMDSIKFQQSLELTEVKERMASADG